MVVTGKGASVELNGNQIIIRRRGVLSALSVGLAGEKYINIPIRLKQVPNCCGKAADTGGTSRHDAGRELVIGKGGALDSAPDQIAIQTVFMTAFHLDEMKPAALRVPALDVVAAITR